MIATLTRRLFDKLLSKPYREAYVEENVRTGVAYQIRALREARGWTQKRFAEILGKPQSVLSRIEDPDYGKLSVQTLLEVAAAFDVALLVQYVDFPDFIQRTSDLSPEALNKESFSEAQFLPVAAPLSNVTSWAGGGITVTIFGGNSPPISRIMSGTEDQPLGSALSFPATPWGVQIEKTVH